MFTRDMRVVDIVATYPITAAVFLQRGIPCFGNLGASFGDLERASSACGVELDPLIRDLNRAVRLAREIEVAGGAEEEVSD